MESRVHDTATGFVSHWPLRRIEYEHKCNPNYPEIHANPCTTMYFNELLRLPYGVYMGPNGLPIQKEPFRWSHDS